MHIAIATAIRDRGKPPRKFLDDIESPPVKRAQIRVRAPSCPPIAIECSDAIEVDRLFTVIDRLLPVRHIAAASLRGEASVQDGTKLTREKETP
jgi:hypothetical protein